MTEIKAQLLTELPYHRVNFFLTIFISFFYKSIFLLILNISDRTAKKREQISEIFRLIRCITAYYSYFDCFTIDFIFARKNLFLKLLHVRDAR